MTPTHCSSTTTATMTKHPPSCPSRTRRRRPPSLRCPWLHPRRSLPTSLRCPWLHPLRSLRPSLPPSPPLSLTPSLCRPRESADCPSRTVPSPCSFQDGEASCRHPKTVCHVCTARDCGALVPKTACMVCSSSTMLTAVAVPQHQGRRRELPPAPWHHSHPHNSVRFFAAPPALLFCLLWCAESIAVTLDAWSWSSRPRTSRQGAAGPS